MKTDIHTTGKFQYGRFQNASNRHIKNILSSSPHSQPISTRLDHIRVSRIIELCLTPKGVNEVVPSKPFYVLIENFYVQRIQKLP